MCSMSKYDIVYDIASRRSESVISYVYDIV